MSAIVRGALKRMTLDDGTLAATVSPVSALIVIVLPSNETIVPLTRCGPVGAGAGVFAAGGAEVGAGDGTVCAIVGWQIARRLGRHRARRPHLPSRLSRLSRLAEFEDELVCLFAHGCIENLCLVITCGVAKHIALTRQ